MSCLYWQFSQALAIRSYTKFVMGVSRGRGAALPGSREAAGEVCVVWGLSLGGDTMLRCWHFRLQ